LGAGQINNPFVASIYTFGTWSKISGYKTKVMVTQLHFCIYVILVGVLWQGATIGDIGHDRIQTGYGRGVAGTIPYNV
jgi:hypothetical protein